MGIPMSHFRLMLAAVVLLVATSCQLFGTDVVRVDGTVHYYNLEGGFWAVRGDDSTTYDPLGGLPPAFQQEELRVFLEAKVRSDLGGIHQVGPIVEIITIRRP